MFPEFDTRQKNLKIRSTSDLGSTNFAAPKCPISPCYEAAAAATAWSPASSRCAVARSIPPSFVRGPATGGGGGGIRQFCKASLGGAGGGGGGSVGGRGGSVGGPFETILHSLDKRCKVDRVHLLVWEGGHMVGPSNSPAAPPLRAARSNSARGRSSRTSALPGCFSLFNARCSLRRSGERTALRRAKGCGGGTDRWLPGAKRSPQKPQKASWYRFFFL